MLRSIRSRLSLMVLASVALVWAVTLVSSYHHASSEVQEWEDARLVEFAQLIAPLGEQELARVASSGIDARVEIAGENEAEDRREDSDSLQRDILVEVLDAGGRTIASSPGITVLGPLPPGPEHADGPWTATIAGTAWRIYTLHDGASGRTVRVMETSNTHSDLASDAARQIVQPLVGALPVLALMLWLAIGRSLAPLRTLSTAIRRRDAGSLEPVGIDNVPGEVRPLVDAIDQLLLQLRQSIARERAFTSDAAHELKTPLTAIKVQAQVALATDDAGLQRLAMQRVVQGVDRSARLVEQLLLLARLDEYDRIPAAPVALDALAREAVARYTASARQKQIGIEIDNPPVPHIEAEPVLMGILFDNLLDNAIKYGTAGGRIEVSMRHDADMLRVAVRDDGPGVPDAERARLADRFYRGAGVHTSGSGLGLSIVARIVQYFDGRLRFGTGIDGRGLAVEMAFRCVGPVSAERERPAPASFDDQQTAACGRPVDGL